MANVQNPNCGKCGGDSLILYGTGITGRELAKILDAERIPFYGFCGRRAAEFPDGLMGKPVISPEELCAHPEKYIVLIAVVDPHHPIIMEVLRNHRFPEDRIIPFAGGGVKTDPEQHFAFPELYRRNTAFVDGGCYDSSTSLQFAEWCHGQYSKIFAFEPDPENFVKCKRNAEGWHLDNFELIQAGLSEREETLLFQAKGTLGSFVIGKGISLPADCKTKNLCSIRVVPMDSVVGDTEVGFIKMDIEGSELSALYGAKHTIQRDKPLLAICVYHRLGDVLAIMDYLHEIVPEYRFWLRHHSNLYTDTVLYAAV